MATDRIWAWGAPEGEAPDLDDVYEALLDYFHVEACWERLSRGPHRIFVTLSGYNQRFADEPPEERFIEIYVDDDHLDVITRMQDDYTCAVADGFYKHIARRWQGVPG